MVKAVESRSSDAFIMGSNPIRPNGRIFVYIRILFTCVMYIFLPKRKGGRAVKAADLSSDGASFMGSNPILSK